MEATWKPQKAHLKDLICDGVQDKAPIILAVQVRQLSSDLEKVCLSKLIQATLHAASNSAFIGISI
jgi:hypothetical protein